MGFEEGFLPVRYLGVPLVTSRLQHRDCLPLIDKMEKHLSSWKNRCLSYAGKLQLVISVPSSMQVYWASVFILPSSVLKAMEKLMRSFLWASGDLVKGQVKVAWNDVCNKPKEDGGLIIRSLRLWNTSLMVNHVWNIVGKSSLWVKWIHTYCLRGRNFWDV